MDESILNYIKKLIGLTVEDTSFDTDIIGHINSNFLDIMQIGVGPKEGFYIKDANDLWTDFMPEGVVLNAVKDYIYLNVKLIFDPPASAALIESINNQIKKLEWRLNAQVDSGKEET